jgi:hypothetical protein
MPLKGQTGTSCGGYITGPPRKGKSLDERIRRRIARLSGPVKTYGPNNLPPNLQHFKT